MLAVCCDSCTLPAVVFHHDGAAHVVCGAQLDGLGAPGVEGGDGPGRLEARVVHRVDSFWPGTPSRGRMRVFGFPVFIQAQ